MKLARRTITLSLTLALLGAGQGAAQQAGAAPTSRTAHADALFNEGKAKLAEQNYAEACPLLAGSFAMDPATGTLLALALCHERAGETKAAIGEYRSAAERAEREGRSDRAQAATKRADELEASLQPKPEPAPPPVIAREKPVPLPVEAYEEQHYEEPSERGLSTGQWIGIVTASAGVVAFGLSAGFAIHANGLNDDSRARCDGDLCTPEGRATRLDAVSAGNVASAMAITGAALAVTGATIFFSTGAPEGSDYALAPWVSPEGAGAAARGRF